MKVKKSEDLKVFISNRESICDECEENLGRKAWITLEGDKGALCLACADLAHLVFLPAGDTALTRRSRKYATLVAVVLKWSRTRKRYERQGLLVEEAALEQAEQDCLEDQEARACQKIRRAEKSAELDKRFLKSFRVRVLELFPACPRGREKAITEHACRKYSGRVGRTAAAKDLEEAAVLLAVRAHIRHVETDYDNLLAKGCDRRDARALVARDIDKIIYRWQSKK